METGHFIDTNEEKRHELHELSRIAMTKTRITRMLTNVDPLVSIGETGASILGSRFVQIREIRVSMSGVLRVCRKCGAEIFADTPEGLCTACLFETGLDLLAGSTVAGVADPGRPASSMPATARAGANAAPHVRKAPRPPKTLANFGDYELLEEIGHTVAIASDIEDELRHLIAVLRA